MVPQLSIKPQIQTEFEKQTRPENLTFVGNFENQSREFQITEE